MITLGVYLVGGGLTALTAGKGQGWVFYLDATRFIAGMGIGGEYAAINSAIDELIPAKYRGRVDIAVNGTYWGGALLATILTLLVVNNISAAYSWRVAFLLGPVLGFIVHVCAEEPAGKPTLARHARPGRGGRTSGAGDRGRHGRHRRLTSVISTRAREIEITPATNLGYFALARVLFVTYPKRAILGATLMITQSFLYNAIFFTYALVLHNVYGVSSGNTLYYFAFFAIGNLAGPLLLGHLFDTIGRRKMISGTYLLSGALLFVTAVLFKEGDLTALTQTVAWCVIFFFASAGASAAYLTVSEIFPIEVRAKAIAIFFAIAQFFGSLGPYLFGKLIDTSAVHPDHSRLFYGYVLGAVVMVVGGLVDLVLGIDAEGKSLEELALPLGATVPR